MRVLVLEDCGTSALDIGASLRHRGLAIDLATSLDEASQLLSELAYDCFVLDWVASRVDMLCLVRELRYSKDEEQYVPVLVISGRYTCVEDRIAAFQSGADDYLAKPLSADELAYRVLALCRRAGRVRVPLLEVGDLLLDAARCCVRQAGTPLVLTPKEYAILELLMRRAGEVVTRSELVDRCWGERDSPCSNVVDVCVASLRRKLVSPEVLRTRRGIGYVLEPRA